MRMQFMKKEIHDVVFEELPAYNMHYRFNSMGLNMIVQSPKLLCTYIREKAVFRNLEKKYNPAFCISDNRFGCVAKHVPNYFISHQWNILNASQKKHPIASRLNQFYIRKFNALLIPDDPVLNLTGILTTDISQKFHAMGILSRFRKEDNKQLSKHSYQALLILSGPEPRRTSLENKFCTYFKEQKDQRFALIRGTNNPASVEISDNVDVFNIVDKDKILELINLSEVTISRSGYSSVMDFLALDLKRVLFVPTSGQTEQEYLANRLRIFHGYESISEKECTVHQIHKVLNSIREIESTERTKVDILSTLFHQTIDSICEKH